MNARSKLLLSAVATSLLTVAATSSNAEALEPGNLTARIRSIYIDPADESDAIGAIGAPKNAIDVESIWAPDIDFEYAVTDKLALELLLTVPQRHDVTLKSSVLGSNVALGTVDHLPPTLTAKYYFLTDRVRPYVGAGVNFTWFTSSHLTTPLGKLRVDSTSFGPALQAGVDVSINGQWSLTFDAKKAWIETDVSLGSTKLTTVNVDPFIYGVGLGYRFGQ